MKLQVQKRSTYTFVIGSALFVVCLIYIPQWGHYAPSIRQSVPSAPYLTPWTVLFVSALSLALALVAAPFRDAASSANHSLKGSLRAGNLFCCSFPVGVCQRNPSSGPGYLLSAGREWSTRDSLCGST